MNPWHDDEEEPIEGLYWSNSGNDYDRHRNVVHNQYKLDAKLDEVLALVRGLAALARPAPQVSEEEIELLKDLAKLKTKARWDNSGEFYKPSDVDPLIKRAAALARVKGTP